MKLSNVSFFSLSLLIVSSLNAAERSFFYPPLYPQGYTNGNKGISDLSQNSGKSYCAFSVSKKLTAQDRVLAEIVLKRLEEKNKKVLAGSVGEIVGKHFSQKFKAEHEKLMIEVLSAIEKRRIGAHKCEQWIKDDCNERNKLACHRIEHGYIKNRSGKCTLTEE